MPTRYHILGAVVGFAAMIGLMAAILKPSPRSPGKQLLSDCDGAVQSLVIHTVEAGGNLTDSVYREFLNALPPSVTVHVCCPGERDFALFRKAVGDVRCTLHPVYTGHTMTCWSRDRWLALAQTDSDAVELWPPLAERQAETWPERKGDSRTAFDLAAAIENVTASRAPLLFDGGDFVADEHKIFVTPDVSKRNGPAIVDSRDQLERILEAELGRDVVLLKEAPNHHAGMYMMPIAQRRMLVGDPALAQKLVRQEDAQIPKRLGKADFSAATQARFDAVAERCRREGYDVIRIPVVPAVDQRTYLSYVNVILSVSPSESVVYMPVYDEAPQLNRGAARIWKTCGFSVIPINCTSTYREGGSLRCLINILHRKH